MIADRLLKTAKLVVLQAGVAVSPLAALGDDLPPVDQQSLNALAVEAPGIAFFAAFEAGDELTETIFTKARGVGAHVGEGRLFTRFPRADLADPGEWAAHQPLREGGPQAQSCITCHALPYANGAGGIALNVAIDPLHTGDPTLYLERNTSPLFALGAVQRIAEEMTSALQSQQAELATRVCERAGAGERSSSAPRASLSARSRRRRSSTAMPAPHASTRRASRASATTSWCAPSAGRARRPTIRAFARGAANNELGMQAEDLVGTVDGDSDGVTHELSVGDLTAIAVYMAALERPTTTVELASLGLAELTHMERATIAGGEAHFAEIGCGTCHKPDMVLDDPVFTEPSLQPAFAEPVLPSGVPAAKAGLSPVTAIRFDVTTELPNNRVVMPDVGVAAYGAYPLDEDGYAMLGGYPSDAQGRAVIPRYSDFRLHDMGSGLADPVDAYGIGASVWPTRGLAGVGSTGPWLHDGRATTLDEAILAHGGEAADSRNRYAALPEPAAGPDRRFPGEFDDHRPRSRGGRGGALTPGRAPPPAPLDGLRRRPHTAGP